MRVAVVVTTYNHAHFLADALASIAAQTREPDEVLVVDDGSQDDPAAVVSRFPGVRILRTENRGLAAARNYGLDNVDADAVLFLDADDMLRPEAIEAGLACLAANPGAAMVYGAYRFVDAEGKNPSDARFKRVGPRAYHALLADNLVGMHGAALYDREKLRQCGGFDTALERCEDYDMYLRLARRHRIACHPRIVADYRLHGANMSSDTREMLDWVLRVHQRNRPSDDDEEALAVWREGERRWKRAYVNWAWRRRPGIKGPRKWAQRLEMMRIDPRITPVAALRQTIVNMLPEAVLSRLRRIRRRRLSPRIGAIDFGDLARITPVSRGFGYKRGTPVDRHYIEAFLERHRAAITGRVLEVADAGYCERFGDGITHQDVLDRSGSNEAATVVGDLGEEGLLEAGAYDCLVVTQTLHLVYKLETAVGQLRDALRPGGVLLATVPGITPVDTHEWEGSWHWSLTRASAERLFGEAFGPENVEVEVFGNAFAATCFLQGIAFEEIGPEWLEPRDPAFPVIVAVRARRAR